MTSWFAIGTTAIGFYLWDMLKMWCIAMMLALTVIWGERNVQGIMLFLSVSRTLDIQ
jgi:cellulose synthase/poly-beta-1,6-N-acetylglucosamine synthase-like glycosyltransferase